MTQYGYKAAVGVAASMLLLTGTAHAQHQDVALEVAGGEINVVNGLLAQDGAHLFAADFGELGNPLGTDDPGFLVNSGGMVPGEILAYEAIGALQFWDGAAWTDAVPNGEQVVVTDVIGFQTTYATSGVTNGTGFVDQADSAGGVHTHIDFAVERPGGGDPAVGAYLIEFSLFGVAADQVTQVYPNTNPLKIAFNYELPDAEFDLAVDALVNAVDSDEDGVPDSIDNCTLVVNAAQRDTDGDGFGNACDTDLNNDNVTNVIDLGLLRLVFFTGDEDADFNGDGVVNVIDLGLMRLFFFQAPGPGAGG